MPQCVPFLSRARLTGCAAKSLIKSVNKHCSFSPHANWINFAMTGRAGRRLPEVEDIPVMTEKRAR